MAYFINPFLKNSHDYDVHGRNIDPIEVIEQWSLCHHLACVVKCLARAGDKHFPLMDLMKAEWYLNRELERIEIGICSCFASALEKHSVPLDKILTDWNLSAHLGNSLAYLLRARAAPPYEKNELIKLFAYQIPLSKSLGYVRLEISEQEHLGGC